jgi:uncharacterized protein YcbX
MTNHALGSVVSIWRYPVKSMMGEELNAADLTQRGVLGDRAHALIDVETGMIASAKNPRKWPRLFDFRASYAEPPRSGHDLPPVLITLPGGKTVMSNDPNVHAVLSSVLGREVVLKAMAPEAPSLEAYWPDLDGLAHRDAVTEERIPSNAFFDLAAIHVLTTATIDQLRALNPEARFEARRFRPNLVVQPAASEKGFVENGWVGRSLTVGGGARLKVSRPCSRCVMTTLQQGDLPRDVGILRTVAQHNGTSAGVYADVERHGAVRRGDLVSLES